jgi:hypothetical protein
MKTNTYINSTIASSTAENDTKSQHSIFNIPCSIFYKISPSDNILCSIFPACLTQSGRNIPYSISYKGMYSKAIIAALLISALLFTASQLSAQEWTEPLNIANLGGYSMDPDMVIDHSGVIHVVWSYRIISSYWKIMYTRSVDDGSTWDDPIDLLQNTDLWMAQPHIACNSKNHLFVTYTHDYHGWTIEGRVIKMLVFDGHQWSEPILVSEGMPWSDYNKVVVDNNDNIFVFWAYGSQFMYYRYLENGVWSDFYCPYCDSTDIFAFADGHSLSENNLHWIGASLSANYFGERLQYYLYDISTNGWSEPQMPAQDTITVGVDIALNSGGHPESVYRTYPSPDDKSKYIKKEGHYWSDPELVAGVEGHQRYQQIVIDKNDDVNITERQGIIGGQSLVHYYKKDNRWVLQYIDNAYGLAFSKLIYNNDNLYCVYEKAWEASNEVLYDLFFVRYDIVMDIKKEKTIKATELKIYPNPTTKEIIIEFENNKEQHIFLSVYDITGRHINTLINKNIPPGAQRILWNGTDKNGKEAKSGSYLVRLKSGRNTVTQIVEIIK